MDKLYVPDPNKWVKYYQGVVTGKTNPYAEQMTKQIGGSIKRMSNQFLIPVGDRHKTTDQPSTDVKLQLVSPAQQVVEQAKDEIKLPLKRKRITKSISSSKKRRRGNTSGSKKNKKVKKRETNQLKKSGKKKKSKQRKGGKIGFIQRKKKSKKKSKHFTDIFY